ncbi:unnamed protein product [Amaranthus hypochondriacus]
MIQVNKYTPKLPRNVVNIVNGSKQQQREADRSARKVPLYKKKWEQREEDRELGKQQHYTTRNSKTAAIDHNSNRLQIAAATDYKLKQQQQQITATTTTYNSSNRNKLLIAVATDYRLQH